MRKGSGIFVYLLVVILISTLGAIVNWLGGRLDSAAHGSDVAQDGVATLQEQLENGLKARRPLEFEFIGRVVAVVERGELSEDLVKSVFFWAVRQNKKTPFPYFQRAIRILAAQRGVDI